MAVVEPVDFRKVIDGLAAVCLQKLENDLVDSLYWDGRVELVKYE